MSDDIQTSDGESTDESDQTDVGELLKNVDIAELLGSVDLSKVLTEDNIKRLLKRMDLATLGGQLGAAIGRKLGAVVGRRFGRLLDSAESDDEQSDSEESDEASTEDDDGEGEEAPVETLDELEEMSYRELQSLAKDTDVKGNLSRDELTEQLADEFDIETDQ